MTNQPPSQPKYPKLPPNATRDRGRFAVSGYQRAKQVGADRALEEWQQREYKLNYAPTYWQNPRRVARYKHVIDSVPEGGQLPDWVDRDAVNGAYEYMKARHNNTPWWEWNYLPNDDLALEPLGQIAAPPDDFLWPNEQRFKAKPADTTPITEQTAATVGPENMPDDLPLWQKAAISIFSSPKAAGGATGAIMGGLEGGVVGAISGGLLGGALGGLAAKYPKLSDALMVLDYPAELLERALGTFNIGAGKVLNAAAAGKGVWGIDNAATDFINNLPAAWKAAHLTYDVTPAGFGGQQVLPNLGTTQYMTPEEIGLDALISAYERIKAGEDADDVYMDVQSAMGFSGQAREMIGHIFADPLNYTPLILARGVVAPLAKIGGNDLLRIAAESSRGLTDTASMYGKLLRTQVPVEELSKMGAVSKWLGGLTQGGEVKGLNPPKPGRFNRLGGAAAGGIPGGILGFGLGGPVGAVLGAVGGGAYGAKLGWSYIGSLTPAARAAELVNNSALNLNIILDSAKGSPEEMVRFVHALGNTPHMLARELSMKFIDAPEGAALSPALKDFSNISDNMLTAWTATRNQRDILSNIAKVTGKSVDDLLIELSNTKDAKILLQQYVNQARTLGGDAAKEIVRAFDAQELTPAKLQEIGKVFVKDGLPHNEDVFRAQLYAASTEHMARWAADWHDVKPDPAFIRLGHTVKAAQSLALLGLNPTYFVNNAVNNIVTMASVGVFGLRPQATIDAIWARVGVVPERLRAGVGAAGGGEAVNLKPIREAATAPGVLSKVDDLASKASDKVGIFSKMSGDVEKWSSAQAYTSGFLQAWGRLWKPGTGFERMPTQLEAALNNIDPGLSGLVYDAIKGGLNQGEVEAKLWSGVTRRSVDAFIPDVAAKFGLSEADAADMLRTGGAYDFLADRLKGDPTDAQINKAFSDLYEHVQKSFDEAAKTELENEAGKAAERVKGEGFQAALDIYDKVELEEATRHLQGFDNWEAAFAEAETMTPGQRGAYYREVKARETAEWERFWLNKQAKYDGISKALGIDTVATKTFVDLIGKNADNYKRFYKDKWSILDKFFNTQYKNAAERKAAWNGAQEDIGRLFKDTSNQEIQIQTQMDDIFVGLFEAQFGPGSSAGAAEWRRGSRAVREDMIREITAFQDSIKDLGAEDRRAAWTQFLNDDYRRMIVERMKANVEGVRKLVGGEGPAAPETQAQARPIRKDVTLTTEQRAATVRSIAVRFEIATAKADGSPSKGADKHILAIAKKYGGPEAKEYKTILDVDPVVARKAFERRKAEKATEAGIPLGEFDSIALPDFKEAPRAELEVSPIGKLISDDIETAAKYFLDILNSTGPERQAPMGKAIDASGIDPRTLEETFEGGTSNQQWYLDLLKEGHKRETIKNAFKRIINKKDTYLKGKDATLYRIKELIIDALKGDFPTESPASIPYLLHAGYDDEAVRVFRHWLDEGVDPTKTGLPEDVLSKLFDRIDEVARMDEELLPPGAIDPDAVPPAVDLPLGSVDQYDTAIPQAAAQAELWDETIWPMLQSIETRMLGPDGKTGTSVQGAELDLNTERALREYMAMVQGQMADTKLASIRWGESRRDAALLNYTRRYGADNLAGAIFPYQFWYTRSVMNWAVRAIDKPGWFANYARMREAQRNINQAPGFPTRLADKMRIPVPFLPAWAGGGVYIDPLHQVFPFEMFAQPWEQYTEQKSQLTKRAQYILQDWVGQDQISEAEASQALSTQSGAVWEKAVTQAQIELKDETSNPWDFITLMSAPNLPISIAVNLMRGKKENISQLPVTRMIQSATAGITPGGINIEGGIRKAVGLPERGEFWDFYLDRQLANMAATGEISTEEATRAMVERSGPAFEAATDQVGKVQATRFFGSALWLDFFPEGEQIQRDLQAEFSKAIDSGDSKAVATFFEEHPEYRARLLMSDWNNPEERTKNFLVSEVWNAWRNLPDLYKREAQDQLGDLFQQAFLDKETRSYDAIDNDTLAYWSQVMGGYVPEVEGGSKVISGGLQFSPAQTAESYQVYQDTREKEYPGISALQEFYFVLPEAQQQVFMDNNPQLQKYWDWRDTYLAKNPEVIPHVIGEDSKVKYASPEVQQRYYQYKADKAQMFPDVYSAQDEYFDLPKNKRKAYLTQHPELKAYWDWQRAYLTNNPDMIPYIKSTEQIAEAMGYGTQSNYTQSGGGSVSYTGYTSKPKSGPSVTYANGKITFAGRVDAKGKAKLKEYGFEYVGGTWTGPDSAAARSAVGSVRKNAAGAEELAKVNVKEFTPALTRKLLGYYYGKDELGVGARRNLRMTWEQAGSPGENFNDYVERILKLALAET